MGSKTEVNINKTIPFKKIKETIKPSGSKKITHLHLIHTHKNPHVKSYANLVLINKYYKSLDKDYIREKNKWEEIVKFNINFLNNILKKTGNLICVYCGKENLKIHHNYNTRILKSEKNNLATVDHVIPTSKDGSQYDTDNMVCACYSCNNNKKDKIGYRDKDGKYYF